MKYLILIISILCLPFMAAAHPGHGPLEQSWTHFLTHHWMSITFLLTVVLVWRFVRRRLPLGNNENA